MPIYTEASLRDMYAWNLRLLQMALHGAPAISACDRLKAASEPSDYEAADEIAAMFRELGRVSGSAELVAAIASISDRLHVARGCEGSVLPVLAEMDELRAAATIPDLPLLRRLIAD